MANTQINVYIHCIFAVKNRNAKIEKAWREKLFSVMGNLINETGCKTIIVNGVSDHVHCLFALKATLSISDVMKTVKAKSSKWLNSSGLLKERFEWQEGYGAFSCGCEDMDTLYNYISNQEQHHHKESFMEELLRLLKEHDIEYNPDYLFGAPS